MRHRFDSSVASLECLNGLSFTIIFENYTLALSGDLPKLNLRTYMHTTYIHTHRLVNVTIL